MPNSEISGFYNLNPEERIKFVKDFANLSEEEIGLLKNTGALKIDQANRMIENVIGTMPITLGIATNFFINKKDYLIPMAIEEPSVVAAASNAAKIARVKGGFAASSSRPIMIGQIQIVGIINPYSSRMEILAHKKSILEKANEQDPILVSKGGGAIDLTAKVLDTKVGPMVIAEIHVDCRDAMGANAVNTMAEAVSPLIEGITGGKVYLRIISNLATERLARAKAIFVKEILGHDVIEGILNAYAFALTDPYRCATHNKGIMNGISSIVLATGNDTRAVEAGAHAYAARSGKYQPLTFWEKDNDGNLVGTIEVPTAVGLIGGATAIHPIAKIAIKILGIKSASELGEVMASVGLAQNLAALRALTFEGIQKGHMKLHARNIAHMAGARGDVIDIIAEKMVQMKKVRLDLAEQLLEEISNK